jgi:hypothetical protein
MRKFNKWIALADHFALKDNWLPQDNRASRH